MAATVLLKRAQSECLGDLTCTPEEEESDEKPVPTVRAGETPSGGQQPGPGGLAPVLPPGRPRARRAQSECLVDLTCTPEEEESSEKPVPTVGTEETPSAGQQAGHGGPAPVLPPRARRVRLQHCPALSASAEEDESLPGDDPSSRQATPEITEVTEPVPGPAPCLECPLLPEDSPHPDPDSKHQKEEPSLESAHPPSQDAAGEEGCASGDAESSSPRVPEEDTAPPAPGTGPAIPSETPPGPDGPGLAAQEEAEEAGLTLAVPSPSPEGTEGTECSEDLAPSPPASKSCLKHKALASRSLSVSPTPPASEPPPQEPTPCALDEEAAPLEPPRAEQGESPQGGAEREEPEPKTGRGGSRPRGGKKFSVASGRAASAEEDESLPGDDPSSRQATPEITEVTEPVPGPAPCLECPLLPEDSPHPDPDSKHQKEEPSLESAHPPSQDAAGEEGCASGDAESSSPRVPEEDTAPPAPGTGPAIPSETPPGPDGPGLAAQEEAEEAGLTLAVPSPSPEGTEGTECSEDLAPSPPASKSCLKHKALASRSLSVSPTPPASEPPPQEPTPCALDEEAAPLEPPRAEQGESPQGGAEREEPEPKTGRGGSRPRGGKKFSVASGRAWPHTGHRERPARPGPVAAPCPVRLPLLRSSAAWRSEAALDDLQVPPEHQNPELEPQEPPSPAERGSQDSGSRAASQAGPGQKPPEAVATPATREPRPSAQEPRPCGDRSPFPVKLRSTSLSFKHRDVAVPEGKGVKRYSAEVRLEKGGPALLSKDDKCHVGAAPTIRGTRTPNGQGKGKARSSEQPGSKPPLPRKPLLQSLTLPYPPAGPDVSPGELDKVAPPPGPRKESRTVEKRLPRRGAEKGLPPAASGPGAEGQSGPPWITITPQKRRGAPEQPPNREDKPGAQTLKPEIGRAARAPERAQEPVRQADFIRSKSFLITPAKPSVDRRQGTKLCLQEGLQRGISLSHQNLAQPAAMAERDLHQLKRASYASAEQPSWMELARKKSQAWSDMPQIIK
ncbi:hypothetical protein MDA_GLEAN10009849 [Myotis davidii]|uniref:DUF4592 domain-containing protein n=1 Tax=Myotis davidii TaxID=225400 RepID=L5LBD7_MYODS|nr:hypothetical protein MDA_GLEAN10009849 [Myotis davidii]